MDKLLIRGLAEEMGVSPQTLNPLRTMPYQQACRALHELKEGAQAAYKKLAFKYHPDRNPQDPETATLKFKALAVALEHVMSLRIKARRPQPVMQTITRWTYYPPQSVTETVQFHTRAGKVTTTSARRGVTSRPNVQYDATRVVFIRVD
jgi:hypothetical protein